MCACIACVCMRVCCCVCTCMCACMSVAVCAHVCACMHAALPPPSFSHLCLPSSSLQVLIASHLPSYELRHNQVESIFLSAIDMYGHQFCPENLKVSLWDHGFPSPQGAPSLGTEFRVAGMVPGDMCRLWKLQVWKPVHRMLRAIGLRLSWPVQALNQGVLEHARRYEPFVWWWGRALGLLFPGSCQGTGLL